MRLSEVESGAEAPVSLGVQGSSFAAQGLALLLDALLDALPDALLIRDRPLRHGAQDAAYRRCSL
jgi:hypothetical protein